MTEKEMDNYIETLVEFSEKISEELSCMGSDDHKDYRQGYDIATKILCAKIIAGGK